MACVGVPACVSARVINPFNHAFYLGFKGFEI